MSSGILSFCEVCPLQSHQPHFHLSSHFPWCLSLGITPHSPPQGPAPLALLWPCVPVPGPVSPEQSCWCPPCPELLQAPMAVLPSVVVAAEVWAPSEGATEVACHIQGVAWKQPGDTEPAQHPHGHTHIWGPAGGQEGQRLSATLQAHLRVLLKVTLQRSLSLVWQRCSVI